MGYGVKFDGWRCQLVIDSKGTRVFTRRGHDWTDKLRIIADAAATEIKVKSAIIDGELVYPHESGRSDSTRCRPWCARTRTGWSSWPYLLYVNEHDMRSRPREERRARLQALSRPGMDAFNSARPWKAPLRRYSLLPSGWAWKA